MPEDKKVTNLIPPVVLDKMQPDDDKWLHIFNAHQAETMQILTAFKDTQNSCSHTISSDGFEDIGDNVDDGDLTKGRFQFDDTKFTYIDPEVFQLALAKMPPIFSDLTHLKTISAQNVPWAFLKTYTEDGKMAGRVFAPAGKKLNEDGSLEEDLFEAQLREWHQKNNTRKKGDIIYPINGHNGATALTPNNGESIMPFPLLKESYAGINLEAKELDFLVTAVHEMMHTMEIWMRDPNKKVAEYNRNKIILRSKTGKKYTFQDWWRKWEDIYLKSEKSIFLTPYAGSYKKDLTQSTYTKDYDKFQYAIAEQICETFMAVLLNFIIKDSEIMPLHTLPVEKDTHLSLQIALMRKLLGSVVVDSNKES